MVLSLLASIAVAGQGSTVTFHEPAALLTLHLGPNVEGSLEFSLDDMSGAKETTLEQLKAELKGKIDSAYKSRKEMDDRFNSHTTGNGNPP